MNLCSDQNTSRRTKTTNNHEFKIIGECSHLIAHTLKPNIYFSKYALLLETLEHLSNLEQQGLYTGCTSPTRQLEEAQAAADENNRLFLERYYKKVTDEMNDLKTKQGKLNRFDKFIKSLEPYLQNLTPGNMQYLCEIKEDFQKLKYIW